MNRQRVARSVFVVSFGLALLVLAALSGAVFAADSARVALHVEGKSADAAHTAIVSRLPKGSQVLEGADVDLALRHSGLKIPLGLVITDARTRISLAKPARNAAEKLKASLMVLARAQTSDRAFVLIVDGKDGRVVFGGSLDLADEDATALLAAFAPYGSPDAPASTSPVVDATPPKPDTARAVSPDREPAADAVSPSKDMSGRDAVVSSDSRRPHDVGTEIFELGAGFELAGRTFSYSDPLPGSQNLRPYHLIGAPMVAVSGALFPAAGSHAPVVRDIGIAFDYGHAFGLKSQTTSDMTLSSSYDRWHVGLRGRIRTGGITAPVIGLMAGVGGLRFTTANPPAQLANGFPDVNLTFLRFGADLRVPVSRAFLALGIGYMHPIDPGDVYGRFTSASVNGIDARVGFGVRIVDGLEARLLCDYDRFFSSFAPHVGDMNVAGGALDQYLGVSLGLTYVF